MSEDPRLGEDGNDRRFRIFFRAFLVLCLIPATIVVFDEKAPTMHRAIAGALWPAFAFMFFAVGRPIGGRLYAAGIALFCLLFGGFGTVGCLLDNACVPFELGLAAVVATIVLFCGRWLDLRLMKGSVPQLLARCATIAGLTAAFYLAHDHRALGGGLMFLVFGVLALLAAFESKGEAEPVEPSKSAPAEPHSPIVLAAGSAAYWLAASSRGPIGARIIVALGTAWLLYTIYRFWRTGQTVKSARE